MNSQNKTKKFACVSTLIGLSGLFGVAIAASGAAANPAIEVVASTANNENTETLRQGIPTRRLGGGTRDDSSVFMQDYSYLAALVMPDGISITTAEQPTLLFYVPEMKADQTGEFVLRDSSDTLVYESTFEIDQSGGTLAINTAEIADMPVLNMDENYQWYFSIVPDSLDRAHDVVVHGGIRRVDREDWFAQNYERRTAFESRTPLQQARSYRTASLWHDAAVTINQLRQENPADGAIASEWDKLLEIAELSTVVETTEPVQISRN